MMTPLNPNLPPAVNLALLDGKLTLPIDEEPNNKIVVDSKLSLIGILVTNANFSERLRDIGKAD